MRPPLPTLRLIRLLAIGAPLWLLAAALPGGWIAGAGYLVLLAVLCIRDYRSLPRPSEIAARRELPPRFSLDAEHQVKLVLSNRSGRPIAISVRDELPHVFIQSGENPDVEIPAQGEARLAYLARPTRRGAHAFGAVVLRVRHPSGLMQKEIAVGAAATVKVYPNFQVADEYRLLAKIDRRDEMARQPRRIHHALGTDFESLRPYVAGEDLRNVDWKATAKRGALISRNKQVEKGQQIAVLLDAGRLMAATVEKHSKLEHAMKATVMLSYVAQKRGDALAVASFSNRIESFLPPVRGAAIVPRVLDSLYAVQARPVESDYWQVIAEAMSMLRRRSLVILLTDVLDAAGSAGLINNLARAAARHLVLCVVLGAPGIRALADGVPATVEATYRKAAAADLRRRRRLAMEHMRARGILVLETEPQRLSVSLVRRYLEIRRADLQ